MRATFASTPPPKQLTTVGLVKAGDGRKAGENASGRDATDAVTG